VSLEIGLKHTLKTHPKLNPVLVSRSTNDEMLHHR